MSPIDLTFSGMSVSLKISFLANLRRRRSCCQATRRQGIVESTIKAMRQDGMRVVRSLDVKSVRIVKLGLYYSCWELGATNYGTSWQPSPSYPLYWDDLSIPHLDAKLTTHSQVI